MSGLVFTKANVRPQDVVSTFIYTLAQGLPWRTTISFWRPPGLFQDCEIYRRKNTFVEREMFVKYIWIRKWLTSVRTSSKPEDDITAKLFVSPKIVNISTFPAAYTTQATWLERLDPAFLFDLAFLFASLKIPNNKLLPAVIWRQYRSAWKLLSCKYTKDFGRLSVKTTVRSMEVYITGWVLLLFCNKFILLGKWFNYKVLVLFQLEFDCRAIDRLVTIVPPRWVWFDLRFNLFCLLV